MQIDSPTIRRLGEMLRERAGLPHPGDRAGREAGRGETSPEARALIERVSPMCEALYLVMIADDDSDAGEIESIRGAIEALTSDGLPASAVDSMLEQYAKDADAEGREERLMQVAARLSADREDAEATLALAAAVALADGSFVRSEESFLVDLAQWLGVSNARLAVILDTGR